MVIFFISCNSVTDLQLNLALLGLKPRCFGGGRANICGEETKILGKLMLFTFINMVPI